MVITEQRAIPPHTRQLMAQARNVLGDDLLMAVATGSWINVKSNVAKDNITDPIAVKRLQHAMNIADLLLTVEAAATIRAWFAGKNPMLDDQAPAIMLASDPDAVRRAARDFLAHG